MGNSLSTVLNTMLGLGKGSRFSDSIGISLGPVWSELPSSGSKAPAATVSLNPPDPPTLPSELLELLEIFTTSDPAVLPIRGSQLLEREHFRLNLRLRLSWLSILRIETPLDSGRFCQMTENVINDNICIHLNWCCALNRTNGLAQRTSSGARGLSPRPRRCACSPRGRWSSLPTQTSN